VGRNNKISEGHQNGRLKRRKEKKLYGNATVLMPNPRFSSVCKTAPEKLKREERNHQNSKWRFLCIVSNF
jgi:hypothetical protein